jgi:quinolinate synthase
MATDTTPPRRSSPLVVECEESKEDFTLPTLTEWRQEAAGTLHRPPPPSADRADWIPRAYALMSQEELDQRISAAKAQLGDRLVILGHHYQRDDIIQYADARGDSFKLAQFAATKRQADYIDVNPG